MKKVLLLFSSLLSSGIFAQSLDAPVAEGVYGGRVNDIVGIPINSDSTRLVIATESSNTLFYADLKVQNVGGMMELGIFETIAGADFDDGFGSGVKNLAMHTSSGRVFFVNNGNLHSVDPSGGAANTEISGGIIDVYTDGNNAYALETNNLHFGTLDAMGGFTTGAGSPIALSSSLPMNQASLVFDNTTNELLIFVSDTTPELYRSSDPSGSFNSSTTMNAISLSGMTSPNTNYGAFGVAPNGYYYCMGNHYPTGSQTSDWVEVSRSMDQGLTWAAYSEVIGGGPAVGITGKNIEFSGNSTKYTSYCGAWYNDSNMAPNIWESFGHPGGVYRGYASNSGAVLKDPNNDSIVYFTTDVALGYSADLGRTSKPLNKGITAVQVFDMDMTSDYSTGWVASKSGIRKVSTYKTSPNWSETDFPMGDGSGYSAIDMANDDTNRVYAGNVRVYKTTNSGLSWQLQFDPTSASGGSIFPPSGTQCEALEVNPFDTSIVMAGFANHRGSDGGLFLTLDGGANWNQILIDASAAGSDVDVHDIIFTDINTAYVGVVYDLAAPTGRSIYKIENISSGSPTVTQDMSASGTASGSLIVASIYDLELSQTGDTLFASGTDAGTNHPICYFKDLAGTALWDVISTSGFPTGTNLIGTAVTVGDGVVFCAVNHEIYTYDLAAASGWSVGYTYPVGTAINFLFYDELLVGTGTGLYSQQLNNFSGIDEVSGLNKNYLFSIYPNPSSSVLHIKSKRNNTIENLKIIDPSGKIVMTAYIDKETYTLDLKELKNGMYIIEIETGSYSETHSLLKN